MARAVRWAFAMTIAYAHSIDEIEPSELDGFLGHWDFDPPLGTLLAILKGSTAVIVAREVESSVVCGYITALSDGVACAYVSGLEVRQPYRGQGIASTLLQQMVDRLDVFGVYLSCAPAMVEFYERAGFKQGIAMGRRKA